MTTSKAGGQLEKEMPLEKVVKRRSATPPTPEPEIPPRPTLPYPLAGNGPQCTYTDPDDGDQCGWLQDPTSPIGRCKMHEWERKYGSRE